MQLKAAARFDGIDGSPRLVLPVQLLLTAAVLGWVPGNFAKLALMLVIWAITFGRITARELLMMAGVNLLFVAMDSAALGCGVFAFRHPDFLGMPVYEYLMWGFYALHTVRFLGGAAPQGRTVLAVAAAQLSRCPLPRLPTLICWLWPQRACFAPASQSSANAWILLMPATWSSSAP